jgi:hypothetical protein
VGLVCLGGGVALAATPGQAGATTHCPCGSAAALAAATAKHAINTKGTGGIGINVAASTTNPLTVGSSSSNGNGAYLAPAGVWVNASDRRIKENIKPIQYGLDAVQKLQPVSYDMVGTHEKQVGFIAQDVFQVVPEVVGVPKDPATEHYGLSYGNMVAVTVKAIQELKADNDNLRAEIATLKNTNNTTEPVAKTQAASENHIIELIGGGFAIILLAMGGVIVQMRRDIRRLRNNMK